MKQIDAGAADVRQRRGALRPLHCAVSSPLAGTANLKSHAQMASAMHDGTGIAIGNISVNKANCGGVGFV